MTAIHADATGLRIALFSGNYNCVRDGANQALNRLVEYLLRRGAQVRVYSPTASSHSFEPSGDLVSIPSVPVPFGRGEYRIAWPIPRSVKEDVARFMPNVCHISVPLFVGSSALHLARTMNIPVVASMHTRFETYPRYYGFGFLERPITSILRRFYLSCNAVVAPCQSAAEVMLDQGLAHQIGIWSRGVDTDIFNPQQRSDVWRESVGLGNDETVIAFLGRLVMEKGLEDFSSTIALLKSKGIRFRTLIIGEGPARTWFKQQIPDAVFVGHLQGTDLGRAIASADLLFNPSSTETFGNVTLEAMACGLPVVAARATGSSSIITHGKTGFLVPPGDHSGYAEALARFVGDASARIAAGQAAHIFSRKFDWDQVNEAMVRTYLDALGVKPEEFMLPLAA